MKQRLFRLSTVAVAWALLLFGAFYIGGGWYLSGVLDEQALEAGARRADSGARVYPIRVVALETGTSRAASVTLRLPGQADPALADGTWGVEAASGGFGQISKTTISGATITGSYRAITGSPIARGDTVRLVTTAFPDDPTRALGIPYQNVNYEGPLGSYPAWMVDGAGPDWAILVHGNSLRRADMIRLIGPIHQAGAPILVITYRNDPGAPEDPSGRLGYGLTEWRDLEAAGQFAIAHGARHLILAGVSMGGGIVMSFLYHSSIASRVSAVILDSPMLDFSRTVDYGASNAAMPLTGRSPPPSLVAFAKWIAGWRFGVDWNSLNYLAGDGRLRTPILLFQGTADDTVPPDTSQALASDRPDLVAYVVTEGAGHVDSWNLDPTGYELRVETFLASHAG